MTDIQRPGQPAGRVYAPPASYDDAVSAGVVSELPEIKTLPPSAGFIAYAVAPSTQEPCPVYEEVLAERRRHILAEQYLQGRYEDNDPPTAPR